MSTNPNKSMDPIEAQAKADILQWSRFPQTENEKRTFARIGHEGIMAGAALIECSDFIETYLSAKAVLKEAPYEFATEPENPKDRIRFYQERQKRPEVVWELDTDLKCREIHNFMIDFLELSVACTGERAKLLIDAVKNMNRQQMPMLSGLLGGTPEPNYDPSEVMVGDG
jgi:hypothetical protein